MKDVGALIAALGVEETALDRALAWVAPGWGLKRRQARVALAASGGFIGAARDRRATRNWTPDTLSADAALLPALDVLRARSHDLIRNEPLARGAVKTNQTAVIGEGLRPRAQIDREVLRLDDEAAERFERAAEREFAAWAESQECDMRRTLRFDGLQRLAYGSVLADGDTFAFLGWQQRPGSVYALKLQLIEAARVCNPNRRGDTPTLAAGVELDAATGAPIAYHVASRHPGAHVVAGQPLEWTRVEAFGERSGQRRMLHLFEPEEIAQTRGMPYLAPVIEPLKQLGRYSEAELVAAVVNACFTITTTVDPASGNARSPLAATSDDAGPASDLQRVDVDFEPGMVIEGFAPNEGVKSFEPGRPNDQFDPFVQAVLRQIGVALEIPYEVLIKHFTASYSAARAALLEAWRYFRQRRAWFASALCQPVWEAFLTEAVARGRLDAPGFFTDPVIRRAWCGAQWIGPTPGQIDPEKEGKAAEIHKAHGWKTDTQITAELNGGDWDRNVVQRGREERLRRTHGLPPSPQPGNNPQPPPAPARDGADTDKEMA